MSIVFQIALSTVWSPIFFIMVCGIPVAYIFFSIKDKSKLLL